MHHAIHSNKKKKEIQKKTKIIAISVFLGVVLLFIGLAWGANRPSLLITNTVIQGNKILDANALKKNAEESLNGNYFYFFPKKNVLIYPKDFIISRVLSAFPGVASADLSIGKSHELIISIEERKPSAIWCGVDNPATLLGLPASCFYVDETGYIFGNSPSFSGDAYFTLYGQGGLKGNTFLGQHFVSGDLFEKIINLRNFLLGYITTVNTIYLGDENYAEFKDDSGLIIKWNIDQDIAQIKSNMQAIFRSDSWKDGTFSSDPEKRKPLEYLDFRFGNKVFYKEKGKELATPSPSIEIPSETSTTTSTEIPTNQSTSPAQ